MMMMMMVMVMVVMVVATTTNCRDANNTYIYFCNTDIFVFWLVAFKITAFCTV